MKTDPCSLCGSTEMNLVDGYYYCVECGTQDMNVRETVVEYNALNDGTFAMASKRRITVVPQQTIEMSSEWYKWHAYNFILVGLADELITLGAKPSFKVKLLWVWTRYIKMYQNKAELGLSASNETEDKEVPQSASEERKSKKKKGNYNPQNPFVNISVIEKGFFVAMLYVALNLDKSDIQLTHLLRFLKEGRLTYPFFKKFVPEGININVIPNVKSLLKRNVKMSYCPYRIRAMAMTLFKKLELGTPVVPDLRKIIDLYLKELCLPKDIKPLILSLMHLLSCDFLEVDTRQDDIIRVPDYEGIIMTYVILALKMCFGLDCEYEVRLSNAVERINDEENYPNSYKFGMTSEPTERLFSFREWCNYLQFRKKIISHHCFFIAEQHGFDMDDDYVYMEQVKKKRNGNVLLKDQITMDILNKIPLDDNPSVIPSDEFFPTLTPLSDYTQVILEHYKDPEMKQLLSEDFTQYSLKYVCEDFELIDSELSKNIVEGINESNKIITEKIIGNLVTKISDLRMVFVRNCENKHWLKTNPPTLEHVTIVEKSANDGNDKEKDHGYVSNAENVQNEKEILSDSDSELSKDNIAINKELTSISDIELNKGNDSSVSEIISNIHIEHEKENDVNKEDTDIQDKTEIVSESDNDKELKMIQEEDEDKNIFDDDFENLDAKDEFDKQDEYDCEMLKEHYEEWNEDENNENERNEQGHEQSKENLRQSDIENESDASSVDSLNFNPDTFNRSKAIKDLILAACQKYKIPIPAEFKTIQHRKRKSEFPDEAGISTKKCKRTNPDVIRKGVDKLLASYYDYVQRDVINQVSQQVKSAIQNVTQTHDLNEPENFENPSTINIEGVPDENQSHANTDIIDTEYNAIEDSGKTNHDKQTKQSNLFDEDSDGEINIDDFIPQGNPKFDEKKYNIDQLYVRIEDDNEKMFDVGPELKEIVDKKIEEDKKDGSFLNLVNLKRKKDEISDSEDEVPLSVIKEEKLIQEQLDRLIEDRLEPLIEKENIPQLNYWMRHYPYSHLMKSLKRRETFDMELKENAPISFHFVINECASVLNASSFDLYKKLTNFETCLSDIIAQKDSF